MEKSYAVKMKNCGVKTFNLGIKRNLYAYDCDMLSMETEARREANHITVKKRAQFSTENLISIPAVKIRNLTEESPPLPIFRAR
jgi:hypothetical protein